MTVQDEFTGTTIVRRAQDVFTTAADAWTENLQKATDRVGLIPVTPAVPVEVPSALVEQWWDFTDRVSKVNREYVLNLTGALNAWSGAVRQHVDGLGEAMRDQAQVVTQSAKEQVEAVANAEREVVDRVEEAEREAARAARAAERQRVRQIRQSAREKYEGLTKAELAEHLASRDLPKTGNVDDLVERLVDADTK